MSEDQNLFFVDKKRKRDVDVKDEVKPVNTEGKKKKKFISGFVSEDDDDEDKLVPTKEENDLAALLFGNTKISNGGRASIPMPPQLQTNSKLVENEEEEEFSDNASEKEESKEGSEDESFEEENKLNYTPAWVDEDEEEPKVTVAGTGSTSRFRKYATKEEIAESNTEVKVVSFKGVRAHNKRHTKPVSISKSQFEERLREQFRTLSRVSSEWAEIKENEEEVDKDKEALLGQASFSTDTTSFETSTRLRITTLVDANKAKRSKGCVDLTEFHTSGRIMYTAGLDKTLSLFSIDGIHNRKVQSVFFGDFPIISAAFLGGMAKDNILLSSSRPYLYLYDINSGKSSKITRLGTRDDRAYTDISIDNNSSIFTVLAKPKVPLTTAYRSVIVCEGNSLLPQAAVDPFCGNDGIVKAKLCRAPNQSTTLLYILHASGSVDVYDTRKLSAKMHTFADEGSVKGTTFAISQDGSKIALGSSSGIVNVYTTSQVLESERPKPLRAIDSLTTSISNLSFTSDGRILFLSSNEKKDAIRAFNVAGLHTFTNWPFKSRSLFRVCSHCISPHNGYLVVGNDHGVAKLFRLCNYNEA